MVIADAIGDAAIRLGTISATPRLDAELLMAHAVGSTREALLLRDQRDAAPPSYAALIERRAACEPVAYILGNRAFWTIELEVTPAVLIPRPDSETLIEAAVDYFRDGAPRSVLDLGVGSGALLLAALDQWPDAHGVGIDASAAALEIASRNAARLGMASRVEMRIGDWAGTGAMFDLVLCNPPYVPEDEALPRDVRAYEPAAALFAGPDGLEHYRCIASLLRGQIAPGGVAAIEVGAGQAAAVEALLCAEGFAPTIRRDIGGRERCLVVHR